MPFSRQELQAAGVPGDAAGDPGGRAAAAEHEALKSGTLPSVADVRRTDPQKLVSLMRGELDWIILKCLEKDRGRRYQAASGLARDVEHYLADEPVEACPPTAGYRLRKFARKYRTPMLVAGAFMLLLALGESSPPGRRCGRPRPSGPPWRARRSPGTVSMRPTLARGQAEQRRDELARLNEDLRRNYYTKDLNLARVAWDENNVSRTRELLEKHRPRPGEPDLRGFEWYYLDRLAQGGELKIDAHAGGVNAESVAFLPDGRRLISSGLTEPLRRIRPAKGALAPFACGTRRPDGRFPSS